jgi:hypothetical protein
MDRNADYAVAVLLLGDTTGLMLGSSMVDALDNFVSSNQITPAAAKMVGLLNPKEAVAQVGVAAEAAAAAATAAAAPASQGVLQAREPSSAAAEVANGAAAIAVIWDPHAAQQQQHSSLKTTSHDQLEQQDNLGPPVNPDRPSQHSSCQPDDAPVAAPLLHCSSSNPVKQQVQPADRGACRTDNVVGFTSYTCNANSEASEDEAINAQGSCKISLCGGLGLPTADAECTQHQLQQSELTQQRDAPQSSEICSPLPGAAPAAGARQLQPQGLSSLYGLALGASVCMADLIRQVMDRMQHLTEA